MLNAEISGLLYTNGMDGDREQKIGLRGFVGSEVKSSDAKSHYHNFWSIPTPAFQTSGYVRRRMAKEG